MERKKVGWNRGMETEEKTGHIYYRANAPASALPAFRTRRRGAPVHLSLLRTRNAIQSPSPPKASLHAHPVNRTLGLAVYGHGCANHHTVGSETSCGQRDRQNQGTEIASKHARMQCHSHCDTRMPSKCVCRHVSVRPQRRSARTGPRGKHTVADTHAVAHASLRKTRTARTRGMTSLAPGQLAPASHSWHRRPEAASTALFATSTASPKPGSDRTATSRE